MEFDVYMFYIVCKYCDFFEIYGEVLKVIDVVYEGFDKMIQVLVQEFECGGFYFFGDEFIGVDIFFGSCFGWVDVYGVFLLDSLCFYDECFCVCLVFQCVFDFNYKIRFEILFFKSQ